MTSTVLDGNIEKRNSKIFKVQSSSSSLERHRCAGRTLDELHGCVKQEFGYNPNDLIELRTEGDKIIIASDKAIELAKEGERLIVFNKTKGETLDMNRTESIFQNLGSDDGFKFFLCCAVCCLFLMNHSIDASIGERMFFNSNNNNVTYNIFNNTQIGEENKVLHVRKTDSRWKVEDEE